MKSRLRCGLALIAGLALLPLARAAPSVITQSEINYRLHFVESSGCEFYRNGRWYDSRRAQAHLRYKYERLAANDLIQSAEDFIERAATKSSLSGWPYRVRCNGGETMTSNQWLLAELDRYRVRDASNAVRAPRLMRGALRIFSRPSSL